MGVMRRILDRIGAVLDRVDERIDKPAKDHGTFLQGSETMIDGETPRESGRSVTNKRSGFGRRL